MMCICIFFFVNIREPPRFKRTGTTFPKTTLFRSGTKRRRKMMGRIIGGVLGSAIGRGKGNHPVAGAVIGAGALFAARRLFPQRYAVLAATAAAAYLTKNWADRAGARKARSAERRVGKESVSTCG